MLHEMVEAACAIPTTMQGRILEGVATKIDAETIRQPVGVCAAITPFNFPAMVPMWFLPFAIACGNTFILKPSEQVPMTQGIVFEIIDELGLPDGVVNMVNGSKDVVNGILDHPGIDAVSFVGSAATAQYIYERAAANKKRVQALGGAKNSMVVMPDAVMDKTADNIIGSAFGAAGQRCMAGSIVVAVGAVHLQHLLARALGLQGRFDDARALLEDARAVRAALAAQPVRAPSGLADRIVAAVAGAVTRLEPVRAGAGAASRCSPSMTHLRSMLALSPWASATAAIDTPGLKHSWTNDALNSALCLRRRRRPIRSTP